jgi:uncharacterized protein (DUF305 family)
MRFGPGFSPTLPSGTNDLTFLIPEGGGLKIPRLFLSATAAVVLAASAVFGAAAQQPSRPAEPKPRPDLVRQPYSQADIDFMSGMIPHHAQAVLIAGWAASHGARDDVRKLCERQVVAQRDEIEFMRNWLRDRGEPVPAANATHHRMKMNGVEHDMLMPGMLTPEQLAELDKARGTEWDRLFLRAMIRHHEGAIKMVDDLFSSYGAMQDDDVYKFASDIYADQSTEIERMQKMLDSLEKH